MTEQIKIIFPEGIELLIPKNKLINNKYFKAKFSNNFSKNNKLEFKNEITFNEFIYNYLLISSSFNLELVQYKNSIDFFQIEKPLISFITKDDVKFIQTNIINKNIKNVINFYSLNKLIAAIQCFPSLFPIIYKELLQNIDEDYEFILMNLINSKQININYCLNGTSFIGCCVYYKRFRIIKELFKLNINPNVEYYYKPIITFVLSDNIIDKEIYKLIINHQNFEINVKNKNQIMNEIINNQISNKLLQLFYNILNEFDNEEKLKLLNFAIEQESDFIPYFTKNLTMCSCYLKELEKRENEDDSFLISKNKNKIISKIDFLDNSNHIDCTYEKNNYIITAEF